MKTVYKMDSSVRIKNANGTAGRKCTCGTWIKHWEELSKLTAGKCSVAGCTNAGTAGAHVLRPLAKDKDYQTHPFIVPMCDTHNGKHDESFDTKENVTFVWANKDETCEAKKTK